MIKIGDVEYRNIQEQVAKNASDIADLDSKIDETKEEITGGSPYTIDMIYQQNVGQDNSIALLQSGKQDKLTAGSGIDITDNVISSTASGGTQLYLHKFTWSGGPGNFAYVVGSYVSCVSTPATNYRTLDSVVFGGTGGKTMRTGYATGGSLYGSFMFTNDSSNDLAMIHFSTGGTATAATIASQGAIAGSWSETVTEL